MSETPPNQPKTNPEIERIVNLCQELQTLVRVAETMQKEIDRVQERVTQLETNIIPDAMQQNGLNMIKLGDGTKIEIKTNYFGSVSPENLNAVEDYLKETNNIGILKVAMNLLLDRGDLEKVEQAVRALNQLGIAYETKKTIHHATMSSFLKENFQSGKPFPAELFGAKIINKAKITK